MAEDIRIEVKMVSNWEIYLSCCPLGLGGLDRDRRQKKD